MKISMPSRILLNCILALFIVSLTIILILLFIQNSHNSTIETKNEFKRTLRSVEEIKNEFNRTGKSHPYYYEEQQPVVVYSESQFPIYTTEKTNTYDENENYQNNKEAEEFDYYDMISQSNNNAKYDNQGDEYYSTDPQNNEQYYMNSADNSNEPRDAYNSIPNNQPQESKYMGEPQNSYYSEPNRQPQETKDIKENTDSFDFITILRHLKTMWNIYQAVSSAWSSQPEKLHNVNETDNIPLDFAEKNTRQQRQLKEDKSVGRYIKGDPLKGYYDFVITEGSYKFWAVFQVGTAILIIYSTFAAIYYSKVNPLVSDYDYTDYLGGARALQNNDFDFVDDNTNIESTKEPSKSLYDYFKGFGINLKYVLDKIDRLTVIEEHTNPVQPRINSRKPKT